MKIKIAKLLLGSALAVGLTLPVGTATFADHDWGNDCHQRLSATAPGLTGTYSGVGNIAAKSIAIVTAWNRTGTGAENHHADWDHSRFDFGIYIHPH